MIKIPSLSIAGAFLALGLSAAPAQANRTWVSGKGVDVGPCPVTDPCRTFAFALTRTTPGGEIDVLDPGGYGPVTIATAISIVNDGVGVAAIGVAASGSSAITINAGANDAVHLRGLTIEGNGSAFNGIRFNTGGNLTIENCVIRNFSGSAGINIVPSTSSSFSVSNTISSNNPGNGITIAPTGAGAVKGVLSKVITNNNGLGIVVNGSTATVTIVDSEASNPGSTGVVAISSAVMLRNFVASNNDIGLNAGANAFIRVAHSVVTGNSIGVNMPGGTICSYGDNDINGNTTDIGPGPGPFISGGAGCTMR